MDFQKIFQFSEIDGLRFCVLLLAISVSHGCSIDSSRQKQITYHRLSVIASLLHHFTDEELSNTTTLDSFIQRIQVKNLAVLNMDEYRRDGWGNEITVANKAIAGVQVIEFSSVSPSGKIIIMQYQGRRYKVVEN